MTCSAEVKSQCRSALVSWAWLVRVLEFLVPLRFAGKNVLAVFENYETYSRFAVRMVCDIMITKVGGPMSMFPHSEVLTCSVLEV